MRFTLVLSLLIAILAVVFALQNPQMMEVNLLFIETQGSTALVLIVTLGIGVLVGLLSTLPGRIRDRRTIKSLEKKLKNVQEASMPSPPSSSSPSGSGASSSAS
jgi:putative membrane protein